MKVLTVMLVAAFLTSAVFAQCPAKGKKDKKTDCKSESCSNDACDKKKAK